MLLIIQVILIHLRLNMSKPAADMPEQKDSTRVPKPLMEKRRRDRINQSLETLRLLLLENTHNEKLKNPKVEKAEILESVVNFLTAEQRSESDVYQITKGKRVRTEDYDGALSSSCKRQRYNEGMRTCLLRVSQFITSKSQEFGEEAEKTHGNLQHQTLENSMQRELLSATPPHRESQVHLYDDSLILPQQHHIQRNSCSKLEQRIVLSVPTMISSPKQPVSLGDSVWRPWPQ